MSNDEQVTKGATVFAHSLKTRVLHECARREASPSMIARQVGVPVANVAYHVRQLYEAGLLKRTGTQQRRGAVEHYYRTSPAASEALAALRAATGELLAATTGAKS